MNNQLNFNSNREQAQTTQFGAQTQSNVSKFLANVFSYMLAGLTITAVISWLFATDDSLRSLIYNELTGTTLLGYVAMFGPLVMVLLMSFAFNKMNSIMLMFLFLTFSVLMGMSFSSLFAVYSINSIVSTLAITAGTFGTMAIVGYTTKTDLTKMGSLLFMALIGIIIAMIVNIFLQSGTMDYIISILGVIIFTGLTAYDVQKLKRIGTGVEFGTESASKLALMGALSLYLDFINLFLFLLRLFGNRN